MRVPSRSKGAGLAGGDSGGGEGGRRRRGDGGEPALRRSPVGLRTPWQTAAPPGTTRALRRLPLGPWHTPLLLRALLSRSPSAPSATQRPSALLAALQSYRQVMRPKPHRTCRVPVQGVCGSPPAYRTGRHVRLAITHGPARRPPSTAPPTAPLMPSLSPSRAKMGTEKERVDEALTWDGTAWKAKALQQSSVRVTSRMWKEGSYPSSP